MVRRRLRALRRALVPGGGVTGRAVAGGVWLTAANALNSVLNLVMLVVIANFLAPADFGLMAIALVTLGALESLSELGLDKALIQRSEADVDRYLDTAWTLQIARGVAIAVVLFLAAPLAADFFGEPRATAVIRVIGLGPLILGAQNPGVMYLDKNMEFHRRFVYEVGGSFSYVVSGVALAVVLGNVWALVFGVLVDRTVRLLASYLLHDYRPRPAFDRELARELYGFGKWITASMVIYFLFTSGDDAFVGWYLSATALGFYQIAYRFSNAPATEVTQIVSEVAFPAYASVQGSVAKLREGFFRTLQVTTVVSFPMAAGIFAISPVFVEAFLGETWEPVVPVMQILAVHGAMRSFGATFGPLFEAVGRPDYSTKLQALNLVILAALIYPLTARWGIDGTALAVLGVSVIVPVPVYLVLKVVDGSLVRFLRTLVVPLAGSVVMGLAVVLADRSLETGVPAAEFVALVLVGVGVYAAVVLAAERWFGYGIFALLRTMRESIS